MANRPDWAQRLTKVRNAKGFSQRPFAKKLGINHSTLIKYEQGETKPKIDVLIEICKMTKINGHWLLTGEGEMEENKNGINDSQMEKQMDRIKVTFADVNIDDTLIEVVTALANPVLTKRLRHGFAIALDVAKEQYPGLFKKSKDQGENKSKDK